MSLHCTQSYSMGENRKTWGGDNMETGHPCLYWQCISPAFCNSWWLCHLESGLCSLDLSIDAHTTPPTLGGLVCLWICPSPMDTYYIVLIPSHTTPISLGMKTLSLIKDPTSSGVSWLSGSVRDIQARDCKFDPWLRWICSHIVLLGKALCSHVHSRPRSKWAPGRTLKACVFE